MTNRLANLLVLTAAPIVVSGFATVPGVAAGQGEGGALKAGILSASRLVSNEELSQMRGGFFTAAGAQFDFGASVQTMVDGKLALLTNVQWTPAGAVTQQLQGLGSAVQAQVASTVAANLANAGIATPGSSVQSNATSNPSPATPMPATATSAPTAPATPVPAANLVANAPAVVAPAATSLATSSPATSTLAPASAPATSAPAAAAPLASLAANAPAASAPAAQAATATPAAATAPAVASAAPLVLTGVQIPDATGGLTQIFSNIAGGQIQNVILNSASGRDITQNTNITMTIYNFAAWQQQVAQNMLSGRLASDMLASSGIGAGH